MLGDLLAERCRWLDEFRSAFFQAGAQLVGGVKKFPPCPPPRSYLRLAPALPSPVSVPSARYLLVSGVLNLISEKPALPPQQCKWHRNSLGHFLSPVLSALGEIGLPPVYIPHYCGPADLLAAEAIGSPIFGSEESVSIKYFDKHRFKRFCHSCGVPVVPSDHSPQSDVQDEPVPPSAVEQVVRGLLGHYHKVLVRGTEGSSGSSILAVTSLDVDLMMSKIAPSDAYLVEPFFSVVSSPNDQWVVRRDGTVAYLGISAQIFDGFRHVGNLAGQYYSPRISEHIRSSSLRLVQAMAAGGYQGVAGIDYIITSRGVFPIENNARMNGSTYCLGIIERLGQYSIYPAAWKFFRAHSSPTSFRSLKKRLAAVLFDGRSSNGIFPVDCEELSETGCFTPVIFGEDLYHVAHLESVLSSLGILPVTSTTRQA